MTTVAEMIAPVRGPEYDRADPGTRDAWAAFRAGGITATEIRDWGQPSKRRRIITEKVTGVAPDLGRVSAIQHGRNRESAINAWVEARFGLTPTGAVYAHGANPRHLASPDGITLDPFTGELVTGPDAAVLETKTTVNDLTPGELDETRTLTRLADASHFAKSGYYAQIQWQMYVMGAARTLFVWERHDGIWDPFFQCYTAVGEPQYAWIPRDDEFISLLLGTAEQALAMIDAERAAVQGGATTLPESTFDDVETTMLVADLLAARDAVAVAEKARDAAWAQLQERLLYEGSPDLSVDGGFAKITVSTSTGRKKAVDMAAAKAQAPSTVERYEKLLDRFTSWTETSSRRMTITRNADA